MSNDNKATGPGGLTGEELGAMRARCDAATPGPLRVNRYDGDDGSINWQVQQDFGEGEVICNIVDRDHPKARRTAEFFASAPTIVPRLLAEVTAWREASGTDCPADVLRAARDGERLLDERDAEIAGIAAALDGQEPVDSASALVCRVAGAVEDARRAVSERRQAEIVASQRGREIDERDAELARLRAPVACDREALGKVGWCARATPAAYREFTDAEVEGLMLTSWEVLGEDERDRYRRAGERLFAMGAASQRAEVASLRGDIAGLSCRLSLASEAKLLDRIVAKDAEVERLTRELTAAREGGAREEREACKVVAKEIADNANDNLEAGEACGALRVLDAICARDMIAEARKASQGAEVEALREEVAISRREAMDARQDEIDRLTGERDEARAWVRRLTAAERVLTCAFCGEAYPPGTPESNDSALLAHVKVCARHPMRDVEHELTALRALLGRAATGLLGAAPTWPALIAEMRAASQGAPALPLDHPDRIAARYEAMSATLSRGPESDTPPSSRRPSEEASDEKGGAS